MPRVHIIGAGLAGLATAVKLEPRGIPTVIYEAAGHAGGRCRSFHDTTLDRQVDNGNHLMLSGNESLRSYIRDIGADDRFEEVVPARYAFIDLNGGGRWQLAPGRWPWWAMDRSRLPPGVSPAKLISDLLKLAHAGETIALGQCLDRAAPSYRLLWQPLTVAALNTEASIASACGLWAVVRNTLLRGEKASRPLLAKEGLSPALIDPAVAMLRARGHQIRFGERVRAIETHGNRITAIGLNKDSVALGPDEMLVLAVPPAAASALRPELPAPEEHSAILNVHFVVPAGVTLPDGLPFIGVFGGTAEWLFQRGDVISVTVSAADRYADLEQEVLASMIWDDVAAVSGCAGETMPAYRMITERRATVAQTPGWEVRRPAPTSEIDNLVLAGDWTRTGIPATLEGAVRSGARAADLVLQRQGA